MKSVLVESALLAMLVGTLILVAMMTGCSNGRRPRPYRPTYLEFQEDRNVRNAWIRAETRRARKEAQYYDDQIWDAN